MLGIESRGTILQREKNAELSRWTLYADTAAEVRRTMYYALVKVPFGAVVELMDFFCFLC